MEADLRTEFDDVPLLGLQLLLLGAAAIFDALALATSNAMLWIAACDLTGLAWLATLAVALWAWRRAVRLPGAQAHASAWRIHGAGQALAASLLLVGWVLRSADGAPPPDVAPALSLAALVLSIAAAWLAARRAAPAAEQASTCSGQPPEGALP